MSKIFGLLDANSFFASCEKVFHPEWEKRPVVVLSNNDGCVVARSSEAKPLIEMGAPYFRIKQLARAAGIVVCSANFQLYGDMSRRVMETLSQWTPEVEVYSIDEAFLDLTGRFARIKDEEKLTADLTSLAREMVETVPRWTGIPVALGIGPTRTLAKLANRAAKNAGKRYRSVLNPAVRERVMAEFPVADIWGVGRRLLPKFQRLGIRTALDLSRIDPLWMRENFTVVQERTVRELRGEVCFEPENVPEPRQNIQVSRSFGDMVTELVDLESAVSTFAAKGAKRLRAQKSVASAIMVQLWTNRFRTDLPQYSPGIVVGFSRPTSNTPEILRAAGEALRRIYRSGFHYKRAMILLTNLQDETAAESQGWLFEPDPSSSPEKREAGRRLMETVDRLNKTLGAGRLFFAAEGVEPAWRPSSLFVSPSFTTDWDQIPVVQAK